MVELNLALVVPAELNPAGVTVRLKGSQNDPLIHAGDLCSVLGVSNATAVRDTIGKLDPDEVSFWDIIPETPREGRPSTYDKAYVTESGFYKIVLTSRAENAKPFRNWVCREVLPCIRKHGCYPAPADQPPIPDMGVTLNLILRHLQQPSQMIQRPIQLIDPREFTLRCWPEASDRSLQNVVRRMDALYRSTVGRPAPQEGGDPRSRLMCEMEHLPCLMQAISYYWRREHPSQEPEFDFERN